jgi:hypothetical protein
MDASDRPLHPNPPMHYGYAQPFLGTILVPLSFVLWGVPLWAYFIFLMAVTLGDAVAKYRVLRRVRKWADDHGITNVTRLPRGGFVSWGWSFWTFAEILAYQVIDEAGVERTIRGSYCAPMFGLIVFTHCELEPVADASGSDVTPQLFGPP